MGGQQDAIRYGAFCESIFNTECLKRMFEPHQPVTPAAHDFIVDCPAGLLKVQVKGTRSRDASKKVETYHVMARHGGTANQTRIMDEAIDILAVFIEPVPCWYIIPRSEVSNKSLRFYPNPSRSISKWEQYKDNWSPFYVTKENDDQ